MLYDTCPPALSTQCRGKGRVTGSIIIQLDVFVSGLMEYTCFAAVIAETERLSNKEATQTDMSVASGTSGCLSHGISLWMGVCVVLWETL